MEAWLGDNRHPDLEPMTPFPECSRPDSSLLLRLSWPVAGDTLGTSVETKLSSHLDPVEAGESGRAWGRCGLEPSIRIFVGGHNSRMIQGP